MPFEYIIEKSAKVQSAKVHFVDIHEMVSIAIKYADSREPTY